MSNYLENLMAAQEAYLDKYSVENAEELLKDLLAKNQITTFDGIKVAVCDEITYPTQGVSSEFACVAGWMPELGYIVLNSATAALPEEQLKAILAHEVGHCVLGHDTITLEQEMQADARAASLGHPIREVLVTILAELERFAAFSELPVDTSAIQDRINKLA